ncbi:TIGR04086 family membrane protein [Heyndrickxia acidiproducens]|uniref:TIGR04086 family membrane protein n=1 Tax=Heyndrickxia acidiproducens TaxID=1121084 RepID=UPI000363B5A8|nr:TIGR04086 family membrane protein [Heyndrickxia acidiproducens]
MQKLSISLLYGLGVIFVLLAIASLAISLILKFTDMAEQSLHTLVTVISFIALFTGGLIGGGKGKKKGWLLGTLTGIIYTGIVFLVQYLGYDEIFSFEQLIYHICYILTAMMGGILGVNLFSGHSREA